MIHALAGWTIALLTLLVIIGVIYYPFYVQRNRKGLVVPRALT